MRVNSHWEKSELSILVCGRFRLVGAFVKFDPPFAPFRRRDKANNSARAPRAHAFRVEARQDRWAMTIYW